MPLLFRTMYREGDRPKVGREKNCLGVRVPPESNADVHPDDEGQVGPGEGMSVAPNWRDLPFFLIPKRLNRIVPTARGSNLLWSWRMGEGHFEEGPIAPALRLRPDGTRHGLVEPSTRMLVGDFQRALAATQDRWTVDES